MSYVQRMRFKTTQDISKRDMVSVAGPLSVPGNGVAADEFHTASNGILRDAGDGNIDPIIPEEANVKNVIDVSNSELRPRTWIPVREEVLWKPTRKIRVISIGAGFSGKHILQASG